MQKNLFRSSAAAKPLKTKRFQGLFSILRNPQHGFYNVIIKNGTVLNRAYAFIEFNDSSYQPHDGHKETPPLPHFSNCPIFDLTSLLLIISEFTRRHTRKSFKKPCKIILFGIPHRRRNIAYAFIGKDKHFLSLFNF